MYGAFDTATNCFMRGIAAAPSFVDNYLDLGYLLCTEADTEATAELLDTLDDAVDMSDEKRLVDWRYIELHHVSIRPYTLDESN